jgi:hypothetical protein
MTFSERIRPAAAFEDALPVTGEMSDNNDG